MIELLVVITIITVLVGILIPAIGLVRDRARKTEARQTISELVLALDTYAKEDASKRFPTPFWTGYEYTTVAGKEPVTYAHFNEAADPTKAFAIAMHDVHDGKVIDGVLTLLIDRGLYTLKRQQLDNSDSDGRLLDPWGHPYHYRLKLSDAQRTALTCLPDTPKLSNWNWDAAAGRETRRSGRDDSVPAPFPYVYSWGSDGSATDARTWLYMADGG
jgi:type II secretory pathway pseudopilin PulG